MLAASIAAPAAAVQTSASVARVAAARAPASEASRLRALRSASRVAVGATIAAVARIHERRVCRDSGRRTSCQSTAVRCKVDSVSTAEDVAWKFDLVRSVGEECQTERELRRLLEKKPDFVLYDGFEPSGRMHIAQGIFKSIAVNKCTKAGGFFTFWVADWFALMNDKMGGDEEKIRVVGEYLIEVWKASGMDMSRVKFLWSSEEISMRAEEYWSQAIDIASRVTLARVKKCCQIMGRKENSLTAAQILYPIMQCTDIFFLKADICQLGVDQRKVNMLARDYCDLAGRKLKPVILSHHMLFGLKAGQAKMSKSDPDSAIFMEDSVEDVERKIAQAYCPSKPEAASSSKSEEEEEMHLVEDALKNPCLDYIEHILFQQPEYRFEVDGQSFDSFQAVKDSFVAGSLTEAALKSRLVDDINSLLEPVREHFRKDACAKELLAKVTEWRRETLTPTTSLTRLDLSSEEEKPRFIVFAPTPTHRLSLESVLHIIDCFKQAPETLQPVLWLDDWSSRSLGCLGSLPVNMASFYEVLLHALRELAPDLMESVQVLRQSEAILSGPSAYWTSIINIGRQHSVEQLGEALLGQDEQLEAAGQVVASLMHVGDVLALSGHSGTVLCGAPASEGMHSLAAEYVGSCGLPKPEVQLIEPRSLWLKDTHEALAAAAEEDGQLLVTDQEVDVNRKIKKAFAEPQNVELCPLLTWVDVLLDTGGGDGFLISRKPANGGNKTYEDQEAVRSDFASGDLHPGDLKPAVSKSINALLGSVRKGFKSNADVKRAVQKLNAYGKALRKKKAR